MYILAKRIDDQDGYTIHGLSESDKVSEAWYAAGGFIFDIDVDDPITFIPLATVDFGDTDEPEESE
jgi:hypothetical protein